MTPGPEADRVLLAHMRDCLDRIREYTNGERVRFDASSLVQDAVIRNLQTLTESSQRLSDELKPTEPQIHSRRSPLATGRNWPLWKAWHNGQEPSTKTAALQSTDRGVVPQMTGTSASTCWRN